MQQDIICGFILSCNSDIPADDEPAGPVSASYKVEHYFQNVADDNYTLEDVYTKTLEGKIGETTTEEAATFTGFTACAFDQQNIAADGSTVVKINYNRNKYKITFDTDGGSTMEPVTLKYEQAISVQDPTKTGFTFYHWDKEIPAKMPAEDLSIKAQWCIRSSFADLSTALSVATDPNEVYNIVITDKNLDDYLIDLIDLLYPLKYALDLSECTETTVIPEGWLYRLSDIIKIILPPNITEIGQYAFYGCENLISVKIFDGLKKINDSTFTDCTNLSEFNIPSTVESIGTQAFYYCEKLTKITIPSDVETIGVDAFYGCSSLSEVIIGKGVKNIGHNAFSCNSSLTSLTFEDPTGWYKTNDYDSWLAKTGGEAVDLSNPATNAAKFVTSRDNGYANYYWYKQ